MASKTFEGLKAKTGKMISKNDPSISNDPDLRFIYKKRLENIFIVFHQLKGIVV